MHLCSVMEKILEDSPNLSLVSLFRVLAVRQPHICSDLHSPARPDPQHDSSKDGSCGGGQDPKQSTQPGTHPVVGCPGLWGSDRLSLLGSSCTERSPGAGLHWTGPLM